MTRTPERRPVEEASVKDEHTPKLCECGCGEPAPIARMTNRAFGYVKGQPIRFVNGHQNRGRVQTTREPYHDRYETRDLGFMTPCWVWKYSLDGRGYGQLWNRKAGQPVRAHRFYYELLVGPIPVGLDLDHLCRVKRCVNPDHLEPVTRAENIRRGFAFRRLQRSLRAGETDKSHH